MEKTKVVREMQVVSNIDIDMEKIISVGVAKAERELKKRLMDSTKNLKLLKDDVKKLHDEIKKEAESTIPKALLDGQKKILEALKLLGVNKPKPVIETTVNMGTELNEFEMYLKENDGGYYSSKTNLTSSNVVFSTTQKRLLKDLKKKENDVKDVSNAISRYRRQLSDVNSIERQMKARVVEKELKNFEGGEALLEMMMAEFTNDMKLLGV